MTGMGERNCHWVPSKISREMPIGSTHIGTWPKAGISIQRVCAGSVFLSLASLVRIQSQSPKATVNGTRISTAEKGEQVLLNVSSKPVDCARSSTARIASAPGMQALPTEMGTTSATKNRKNTHMACLKRRRNHFAINRRVANTYLMWRGAFFRHRPGGEIATALLAIERLAASNAMVPPKELPAMSTGVGIPISRIDLSRPSTRLGMFGTDSLANGGVNPNPAMSKAITRRVAHRCGVTAFQAACDIPIPCSKMSGRPAPDSL